MRCCAPSKALQLNPGDLRHRVAFEAPSRVEDGVGGGVTTWTEAAAAWAEVKPYRGLEVFRNQQLETPVTHKVRLRWQPGIDTTMRLKLGQRVMNIASAINVEERNLVLELLCVEGETDA